MLAEACGQALARARLQRQAEIERGRAELLAEMSFALDYESGVEERLGRLAGCWSSGSPTWSRSASPTIRAAAPRLAAVAHADAAEAGAGPGPLRRGRRARPGPRARHGHGPP